MLWTSNVYLHVIFIEKQGVSVIQKTLLPVGRTLRKTHT